MKLGDPLDGQGNPLNNVSLQILSSAPTSGLYEGRTYYDSTLKCERTWTGTAWTNKDGTATTLNRIAAPTTDVSANGHKFVNLATPTTSSDAATKGYIDGLLAGISSDWHVPVRATSTGANVTVASAPSTLDGVTLANNDRVLLRDQTTASENGVWVFNGAGSALTRPTDWVTGQVKSGDAVIVAEGTTYDNSQWILATNGTITVGTTSLTFIQPAGGGVTRGSIGATGKYATTVGDGTTTTFTITHSLNTRDVTVSCWTTDSSDNPIDQQLCSVTVTGLNTISVVASSPVPAASGNAGRLRVVVVG